MWYLWQLFSFYLCISSAINYIYYFIGNQKKREQFKHHTWPISQSGLSGSFIYFWCVFLSWHQMNVEHMTVYYMATLCNHFGITREWNHNNNKSSNPPAVYRWLWNAYGFSCRWLFLLSSNTEMFMFGVNLSLWWMWCFGNPLHIVIHSVRFFSFKHAALSLCFLLFTHTLYEISHVFHYVNIIQRVSKFVQCSFCSFYSRDVWVVCVPVYYNRWQSALSLSLINCYMLNALKIIFGTTSTHTFWHCQQPKNHSSFRQ